MSWQVNPQKSWSEISRRLLANPQDVHLRTLVLAAHPDDETIGASALLSRFPQSTVVFLTDGAPQDTRLWSSGFRGSREEYAEIRRQEAIRALGYAGISEQRIFCLGGIDQEAAFEISLMAERFAKLLTELRPGLIVTHAYEGGHPDHDSAAVVARIAISMFANGRRPHLLEMTSYHARDESYVTGEFLNDGSTPEISFHLSQEDQEQKRRMMDAYVSQRQVLAAFSVDRERLRMAPEYDFSQPPHPGKLWYECRGRTITGTEWRELASAVMAEFPEPLWL